MNRYYSQTSGPEVALQSRHVTVIGTAFDTVLPDDIEQCLKDGICIDRRNNTPMEMDAYSIYLALKAIELSTGSCLQARKKLLADAVIKRMNQCGGFWRHGAWTGSELEVHMRFTAAAIRLLVEAIQDNLIAEPSIVVDALKRHLSFAEKLEKGLWFLHDSLESKDVNVSHPGRLTHNYAFGSSDRNCLVLNTHLDTLLTMMHVMRRIDLTAGDQDYFRSALSAGVDALRTVLRPNTGSAWSTFEKLDSLVRSVLFRSFEIRNFRSFRSKATRYAITKFYFPVRQRVRSWMPGFLFTDGYTERDIRLDGISFEYHVANLYDLTRFALEARASRLVADEELLNYCDEIVYAGINYVVLTNYWHCLVAGFAWNGKAIILCETMVAWLSSHNRSAPAEWVKAYCAVRRVIPPTPALLGYDPISVSEKPVHAAYSSAIDVVELRDGRQLVVDIANETFTFNAV
ncbi:hypothetical protein [Bradyrhizobium sp. LTSP857]|uniref:hypothetical protein n=1 Tax=Bradyrhizobium sp. LTSP857 TaxID=1619231 RepID=UPI000B040B3F|nr:hypothetical protein [Bradyrhizobium sp. LTSP857]